jgi:hypothetical protein
LQAGGFFVRVEVKLMPGLGGSKKPNVAG